MKILILGARGFLGSAVAREAYRHGHTVSGIDCSPCRLPPGLWPAALPPPATFDLLEPGALAGFLERDRPGAIVNAAGANLSTWLANPRAARRANVELAARVAEAAHRHGLPLTHISCKSVYGTQAVERLNEETSPQPRSQFAAELLDAEDLLVGWACLGLDLRVVRACAVYGPAAATRPSFINARLTRLLAALQLNQAVKLIGSPGDSCVEQLYVEDFAAAVRAVALAPRDPAARFALFNVGSGRLTSLYELGLCLKWLFPHGKLLYQPLADEFDGPTPPLAIGLMKRSFGWAPLTRLRDGLRRLLGR